MLHKIWEWKQFFNVGSEGWALEFEEEAIMSGSTVEHVKDAAPMMGKYFDILAIRTFPTLKNSEEDYSELYIKQFIKYCRYSSGKPGKCNLTSIAKFDRYNYYYRKIYQCRGKKKPKIVLTWAPHVKPLPQCVANSFAQWINAWGEADFVITHPEIMN